MPVILSEPLTIGVAVMRAAELDAAALVAVVGVPDVLLIPFDEEPGVAWLDDEVVEWAMEEAVPSWEEVLSARGSTAYC